MPSQPDRPCVVRKGQRLEVTDDGWILPDGTTRETLDGCEIQPGASIVGLIESSPPKHHKHRLAIIVDPPETVSEVTQPEELMAIEPPDAASPDELHAATIEPLPDPPRLPPEAALHPATVAVAVAAVGATGWVAVKAIGQLVQGNAQKVEQQRKEEERKEREQCASASDDLVNDFRARVADFKTRKTPDITDPTELWQQCDALEARADYMARWLATRAKTRRV